MFNPEELGIGVDNYFNKLMELSYIENNNSLLRFIEVKELVIT